MGGGGGEEVGGGGGGGEMRERGEWKGGSGKKGVAPSPQKCT